MFLFEFFCRDSTDTSDPEADCQLSIYRWQASASRKNEKTPTHCLPTWDSVLCWPATPLGQVAKLPCFPVLNGIPYDTSQNATRLCQEDAVWAGYSDYTACKNLRPPLPPPPPPDVETNANLYFFGYITSLIALGLAVAVFLLYK